MLTDSCGLIPTHPSRPTIAPKFLLFRHSLLMPSTSFGSPDPQFGCRRQSGFAVASFCLLIDWLIPSAARMPDVGPWSLQVPYKSRDFFPASPSGVSIGVSRL